MQKIAFIGAGNMAQSIIGGLISTGTAKNTIWATARSTEKQQTLNDQFAVNVTDDNIQAIRSCEVVVLAVKPVMMADLCAKIAPEVNGKLVISVAAGISCETLAAWLGPNISIVRCMPNTPALIGEGAAGLFANQHVSDAQKEAAEAIMQATGIVHWVTEEELIHAVTAVSGSGPAYFFLFLEAMTQAGVKQGLSEDTAKALAIQTAKGAALLAETSADDLATLRKKVTSPGGTTEQAILSFERSSLIKTVDDAMAACANRSKTMAKELT